MIRLVFLLLLLGGCSAEAQQSQVTYEDLVKEKPPFRKVADITNRGLDMRIMRNELEIRYMESLLKRDSLENIVEKHLTKKD